MSSSKKEAKQNTTHGASTADNDTSSNTLAAPVAAVAGGPAAAAAAVAAAAVAAAAHNESAPFYRLTDDLLARVASCLELKRTGRLALTSHRLCAAASTVQQSCAYLASELVTPLLTSHQISTVGERLEVRQLIEGPENDKISSALKDALESL